MTAYTNSRVEVEAGQTYGIPKRMLRRLRVAGIRSRERSLVLLRPKQVDGVHGAVFFNQTSKVSVKCRL